VTVEKGKIYSTTKRYKKLQATSINVVWISVQRATCSHKPHTMSVSVHVWTKVILNLGNKHNIKYSSKTMQ